MRVSIVLLLLILSISHASAFEFGKWARSVQASVYKFFTGKDLDAPQNLYNSTMAEPIPDGNYTFFSAKYGSVFTAKHLNYLQDNTEHLTLRYNHAGLNQQFAIKSIEKYYYTITCLKSGNALTFKQDGKENFAFMPYSGSTDQQFFIYRLTNETTFVIQSRLNQKYLTAHHKITGEDGNGRFTQRWRPLNLNGTSNTTFYPGRYSFISQANGNALDIHGASQSCNAPLIHYTYRMSANQRFLVRAVDETYFTIVAENSGMALTTPDLDDAAGSGILQEPLNGDSCQQWKFVPRGNGTYAIESRLTGLDIAVTGIRGSGVVQKGVHRRRPSHKFYALPAGF